MTSEPGSGGGYKNLDSNLIYKCNKYCLRKFYHENYFNRNIQFFGPKLNFIRTVFLSNGISNNVIEEPPHLSRWMVAWFRDSISSLTALLG